MANNNQFINAIADFQAAVGHDLASCTDKISNFRVSIPQMAKANLVFVDTPGFNDMVIHRRDVDILKMVVDWLKSTYVFVSVDHIS